MEITSRGATSGAYLSGHPSSTLRRTGIQRPIKPQPILRAFAISEPPSPCAFIVRTWRHRSKPDGPTPN
jgi:hypothetical protein